MKFGKIAVAAFAGMLAIGFAAGPVLAADPALGKAIVEEGCRCHSKKADLNGKDAAFITSKLEAYRKGEGDSKTMIRKAAPLSDEDIANIAAYYSSIK